MLLQPSSVNQGKTQNAGPFVFSEKSRTQHCMIFLVPAVTSQAMFLDFSIEFALGDGPKNSRIRASNKNG